MRLASRRDAQVGTGPARTALQNAGIGGRCCMHSLDGTCLCLHMIPLHEVAIQLRQPLHPATHKLQDFIWTPHADQFRPSHPHYQRTIRWVLHSLVQQAGAYVACVAK